MRAWEMEYSLMQAAIPEAREEAADAWLAVEGLEKSSDQMISMLWSSRVPGSGAPERLMVAAVQALENRGMQVDDWEELVTAGLKALEEGDMVALHQIHARLNHSLINARRNENSDYWNYQQYRDWESFRKDSTFPEPYPYNKNDKRYAEQLYGGWLAQIIGGALGTSIEGYTTSNLRRAFGEIRNYLTTPSSINDDITYELAFLSALEKHGRDLQSEDIALEWIGLIPFGWSAELIALENIRMGILPPRSGWYRNPFCEWIGAQMRGAVCGMVAPGDPEEAARLAWIDGQISHANNGIIGEVFNAVITALAFVERDVPLILEKAISMLPKRSEYYTVVDFALTQCKSNGDWQKSWYAGENRFKRYNWVHAYPNAVAEVIALWYGKGDFEETLHIVAMEGQDVDCNAAQIMTVLGIITDEKEIPDKWKRPIGDTLNTYVRSMKKLSIKELAERTAKSAQ